MQSNIKAVAQMPVQVVALKSIMVAGEIVEADAVFTMSLDEYGLVSGDNVDLAPGEAGRIKDAILAAQPRRQTIAEYQAEQAERNAINRASMDETTAVANARYEEGKRRRDALESLIQGALSGARANG
jgi:hypothetical protein